MARISIHAAKRIHERLPPTRNPLQLLETMWQNGRAATNHDFHRFETIQRRCNNYRVGTHESKEYMIVRSTSGKFITVIKLGNQ